MSLDGKKEKFKISNSQMTTGGIVFGMSEVAWGWR